MAAIRLAHNDDSLDLTKLSQHLKKELPSYARPLFIRLMKDIEYTGMTLKCARQLI